MIIDVDKGKITDVSELTSEILGGKIMFAKGQTSSYGVTNGSTKTTAPLSITLESVSINLPRLALLMKPALASMALRKKEISDLTRRGLNPILVKNRRYLGHFHDQSSRFANLDGEKYGKNSTLNSMDDDYYSQGIVIKASEIHL